MGKDTHISILGVMSGTSLDGLDLCLVEFSQINSSIQYAIVKAETIVYDEEWKSKLRYNKGLSASFLAQVDAEFARFVAEEINGFLINQTCDLIASHGQTILHKVDDGYTLQIGNGGIISSLTNLPVISDFRTQDVALGGQGAPLVPIGDRDLFSDYDACLNIGGFANISFDSGGKRVAFDVCPVNYVLNTLAMTIDLPFDEDGVIASKNKVNQALLNKLLEVGDSHLSEPKSLGAEYVEKIISPILDASDISAEDKIATYTEFCACTISKALSSARRVLVTGGGVYNKTLCGGITNKIDGKFEIPSGELIEFKEALIFAYLGYLRWHKKTNVLSSVTGAMRDSVSGAIYYP